MTAQKFEQHFSSIHVGAFGTRWSAIASICAGPCGRLRRASRLPSDSLRSSSAHFRPAPVARQLSGRDSSLVRGDGCEFFLLSQVRFSRRRRCRTQKCGQLDLSSPRACWLVIYQVWLSRVARRQMRAVRVMRLGMRTYRISCMDVTDSICRRAAILSPHIANFR